MVDIVDLPMGLKTPSAPSVLFRGGDKIFVEGDTGTKSGAETRKDHRETAPPGDTSHIQPPNSDNIADAKKCLLTGA